MEFRHEFGWTGYCEYCGVRQETVEDNRASAVCDIVRHKVDQRTAIIVACGAVVCAILLVGIVL